MSTLYAMRRTVVIGDVHGCFTELMDLFDRLALAADDLVISVGDLVDRGPSSLEGIFPAGTYWHERYTDDKPIVFGHHVVGREPFVRDDRVYGIDTGACHGWALTALSVPDLRLWSVPAREDHWARAKREWQVRVLEGKPWGAMTFEEIAERIDGLAHVDDAGVRAFLAAKREWARALEALHEELLAAVASEVARLRAEHGEEGFAAAARAHPASSLLFQARAGRLRLPTIRSRASTPERTQALAAALGVATE